MRTLTLPLVSILLYAATDSQAATITYWLKETDFYQNAWELRAYTSAGDNGGLAAYGVALLNGKVGAAAQHLSPRIGIAENANFEEGPAGFSLLRTLTQTATGSNITGAQDAISPTPHLIYGFGQEASSFAAHGLTPYGSVISPTWESAVLLAKVTSTTGSLPRVDHRNLAATLGQVFAATGSTQVIDAQLRFRITYFFNDYHYPEPTSITMAGIGLIGLVSVTRRR